MIHLEPGYAFFFLLPATGSFPHFADGKMITGFIILVSLLILSTLLSAARSGYAQLTNGFIERLKTSKKRSAATMLRLCNNPDKIQGTINASTIILNVIITVLAIYTVTLIIDISDCRFLCYLIYGIIILLLILLFSYIFPRLLTTTMNQSVALFMAASLSLLEKILMPLISLPPLSSPDQKRRTGNIWPGIIREDISGVFEQATDDFNEDDKILEGIVKFGHTSVSTIMCPRINVTAIDIRAGFEQLIQVIINSGFSRIPAYADTFDNIKGIIYAKDILPYMSNPLNFEWQTLLREPYFVPESKRINDLLKEFQVKKFHMAVVIDEYGGTSGIVTLEDILEEIVGEIIDESDEVEVPCRKIDEKTFVFEGRILLNEIIKILNLNTDPFEHIRGEAETLAGLILEITGEIPEQDQTIRYRNFIFTIQSADKRRIKEVRLEINSYDDKPEE